MIAKERLLSGLHELVYVEEGMMGMFSSFAKALVRHTEGMEENKKKDLENLLSILHRDSTRHKKMIDEVILKVEASEKYEY